MKYLLIFLFIFFNTQNGITCDPLGLTGFLPENDLYIHPDNKSLEGVTEEEFNQSLQRVDSIYSPIFSQKGLHLNLIKDWKNGTVNAYAKKKGRTRIVHMFGGLARFPGMTKEVIELVACHEIGHHIGGTPKRKRLFFFNTWATNEGQADYFATLKCMRRLYQDQDISAVFNDEQIPLKVKNLCQSQFTHKHDQAICLLSAKAGAIMAIGIAKIKKSKVTPDFFTPDSRKVRRTFNSHPAAQCRLDTYFAGALCDRDYREDVASYSKHTLCSTKQGDTLGIRPRCWFRPKRF